MNRGVLKECIVVFTLEINRIHLINRLKTISSGYFILNFFIWYILILFFFPQLFHESLNLPTHPISFDFSLSQKKKNTQQIWVTWKCVLKEHIEEGLLCICASFSLHGVIAVCFGKIITIFQLLAHIFFYISVAYKACTYLHLNLGSLTLSVSQFGDRDFKN